MPACKNVDGSPKKRYATGPQARWALQIIRRNGERNDSGKKPLRAYPCPACHGYHLSSNA